MEHYGAFRAEVHGGRWHKTMNKANILKILVAVAGASALALAQEQTFAKWHNEDVLGYTYRINSQTAATEYSFAAEGYCPATIGLVNGPVAAPLYQWSITTNGHVVIRDHQKTVIEEWTDRAIQGENVLVITGAGRTNSFIRTKRSANKPSEATR